MTTNKNRKYPNRAPAMTAQRKAAFVAMESGEVMDTREVYERLKILLEKPPTYGHTRQLLHGMAGKGWLVRMALAKDNRPEKWVWPDAPGRKPAPEVETGPEPSPEPPKSKSPYADDPKAYTIDTANRTLVGLLQAAADAIDNALAYAKEMEIRNQQVEAGVAMLSEVMSGTLGRRS